MNETHVILGVHIRDRVKEVSKVQPLLTEYGCYIRTRLGLHQATGDYCSPGGVLLLEMIGGGAKCDELAGKLAAIPGVFTQKLVFGHED